MTKVSCVTILTFLTLVESSTRTYYIGIREEKWNYAPGGRNLITGTGINHHLQDGSCYENFIEYKKALYKEYTDGTFTTEVPKPKWLGFVGPVIRAAVGDDIVVHMKNFATRPYSIHPHGVYYKKDSEGAWYPDGTSAANKSDDSVAPGQSYTYTWKVTEEFAPKETDSSCLTSMYHSHVNAVKDIASGLIGVLLICKKDSIRRLHSEEFFLMFSAVDENLSWYIDDNLKALCPKATLQLKDDDNFQNSNQLHSINGFVYGNLPTLEVCIGTPVFWHVFGIGNTIDLHSIHFFGHTLLNQGHRTDVLSVFPATSVTAEMVPKTIGKWLFGCVVDDYMDESMRGFFNVSSCDKPTAPTATPAGHIRRHYIAAEEILWKYAPSGKNMLTNTPLNAKDSDSEEFFSTNKGKLGGEYWKVRYIGYHDDTFTSKIEQTGSEKHQGILGPVIRGEPGDVIEVTFRNKATHNFSMQPHGVSYDKSYEGVIYQDGSQKPGASVAPGQTFTYRWRVTEGPSPSDPPCLSYLYYSGTNPTSDTNSGLVGPLQICKKGVLDESGRQHRGSEVQKEFFLLFNVMDETESWYLQKNIEQFGSDETEKDDQQFQESNKMSSVNGFMYGNLPELNLCEGDHVVWHLMALGSVHLYSVYFQGNTIQLDNTTRDTVNLFPHSSVTVSMKPDNDGLFELSSLTNDDYRGGMRQLYMVKRCTLSQNQESTFQPDVYFYLAAEEVEWNYAPNRTWELEKHNNTFDESKRKIYLEDWIGSVYRKVVYRRYKDETFTEQDTRGSDEEHLGILGPILRVQVGEKVQVVFKNKATRPYSVHAHGVKASLAKPVEPGSTTRYNWTISSGPGPTESTCTTYAYYSSASFLKDLASGLIGPLVVCRKGTLNKTRQRTDVDKEFALLFMVFDENESWYLKDNIQNDLKKDPETFNTDSEGFMESNMMHGINGKLYANLHGLRMRQGDRTEWYLMALGNDEMYTVHFHGVRFLQLIYRMLLAITLTFWLGLSESATRTHYLGIREVYWNYEITDSTDIVRYEYLSNCFTNEIKYKKAVYKEYTDGNFITEVSKPQWMGLLGPVIRAEVGDDIVVHMKNFASRPYSIHPHGVYYKKDSEGAWYPDGTSAVNKSDDSVAPGQSYTYTWKVTEEFAPKETDSSCLTSMYHSHVNAAKDIASGLIGVLLICKKGALDQIRCHQSVSFCEYFLMFSTMDESLSWYFDDNINEFCPGVANQINEEDFQTSKLHSINGFVYGSLPTLEVCLGTPVFWHLFSIGNTIDLHSIHFYGHTLLNQGHRTDVVSLFPATSLTAEMVPMTTGKWLFRCQVDDHIRGPVIRGEPGDVIEVTFRNKARYNFSLQPRGVSYDKSYEGVIYPDGSQNAGASVAPGQTFTYRWQVIEGPSPSDPPCLSYLYYSGTDPVYDTNSGLVGTLQVCKKGVLDESGRQGNTIQLDNTTRDTVNLFPHSSVTVSMKPDNDGLFELSSLTADDYRGGMRQLYMVKRCTPSQNQEGTFQPDVYFYLAAEEVEWNYAPNRTWELEKHNTTLNESPGSIYLNKSENWIGPVYRKVVYRMYKDETFTEQVTRGSDEEHLGILGPILRVQVGEMVQVVFKNKATRPYSVHAHGVKASLAEPVEPGSTTRYNWTISSGPGPTESTCTTYAYYSTASFLKDLASGLIGPLVVCRKGTLNKTRQRTDVDKEFALLFMVFDENESWYLKDNIQNYLKKDPETFNIDSDGFMESNMMHGINGKLYANLHGLRMRQGDRTEWYLMALGNDEMYTVHFHGQSFVYKTDHPHRADVYGLFPGTFKTIELQAGTPGTWLLHCHVTDHMDSGMETTFTIEGLNKNSF
ncbi:hypothetical protein C0J45_17772 [Silurus meridionalis]|nr:hypothetical protein C0J45_17772 [Silurus meridionalis]